MPEHWTDRLSEYLDGDLRDLDRNRCAAHLAVCAHCRGVLEGLTAVRDRVGQLPGVAAPEGLWRGIERQIDARRMRRLERRIAVSLPQLAAASLALVAIGAAATWLALGPTQVNETSGPPMQLVRNGPVSNAQTLDVTMDPAVADLERILEDGRDRLDSTTVRVLEENLRLIDQAIRDARAAVDRDPANGYLNGHLADTMRRKIDLLRQAANLVATSL